MLESTGERLVPFIAHPVSGASHVGVATVCNLNVFLFSRRRPVWVVFLILAGGTKKVIAVVSR